jgi:hypothetical protein
MFKYWLTEFKAGAEKGFREGWRSFWEPLRWVAAGARRVVGFLRRRP